MRMLDQISTLVAVADGGGGLSEAEVARAGKNPVYPSSVTPPFYP